MAEWGFNFIRLPTDYHIWTVSPGVYREQPLKEIDQVIAWARARGIHVNLCLHRAPGYCVNPPKEPLDLWGHDAGSDKARRQFAAQWHMFATRYRGIPSADLSFDLVNEPPDISGEEYVRAITSAVAAIREVDPIDSLLPMAQTTAVGLCRNLCHSKWLKVHEDMNPCSSLIIRLRGLVALINGLSQPGLFWLTLTSICMAMENPNSKAR